MRELFPNACRKLCAEPLPADWKKVEANASPRCTARANEMRSLMEHLRAEVLEFRAKEALAYPLAGFLALVALAMFSGVRRGPQDLAEYAASLSQGQLRALGFRADQQTGRIRCPGESTFQRVLPRIDAAALERALLLWQEQVLGPSQDKLVIVDGKTLRHAHVELVSAVDGQGRWLGTLPVKQGSNEIPAARELLAKVPLENKTSLADALHTQIETAQQILFEGGGDYALTVKENQKVPMQRWCWGCFGAWWSAWRKRPSQRRKPTRPAGACAATNSNLAGVMAAPNASSRSSSPNRPIHGG